jgi:queuine tRNA-ribosyltransferase subunit QTRTD1
MKVKYLISYPHFFQIHLPEERLKIIHGAYDPKLVLKMVKSGVDLFDTTYPVVAAENGFALTFNYRAKNL